MNTESESSFERFCSDQRLHFERIATASDQGEPRPDYRLVGHDGTSLFAEIKEVTPNAEEREQERLLLEGKVGSYSTIPGARMRDFIAKANPQLRALTKGGSPGLLVVLDTDLFLRHHTEPYAVLTAMRGLDVVPVLVPKDPGIAPQFLEVRSGPKKKMTLKANTSTSAVIILTQIETGWSATVYHNRYAKCPLLLSTLAGESFAHKRMTEDERGWESCPAAV